MDSKTNKDGSQNKQITAEWTGDRVLVFYTQENQNNAHTHTVGAAAEHLRFRVKLFIKNVHVTLCAPPIFKKYINK